MGQVTCPAMRTERHDLGLLLYPEERSAWRSWLEKHHQHETEVWLVYHAKASGKPSIPYDDAVEEALCFGWIDGVIKTIGPDSRAQRWTPRKGSEVSGLNQARMRKLERLGRMTQAGRDAVPDYEAILHPPPVAIPPDIEKALRRGNAWDTFQGFPEEYRRIRVAWVDMARSRPEEFDKRLAYLVRMTQRGKMYGTLP